MRPITSCPGPSSVQDRTPHRNQSRSMESATSVYTNRASRRTDGQHWPRPAGTERHPAGGRPWPLNLTAERTCPQQVHNQAVTQIRRLFLRQVTGTPRWWGLRGTQALLRHLTRQQPRGECWREFLEEGLDRQQFMSLLHDHLGISTGSHGHAQPGLRLHAGPARASARSAGAHSGRVARRGASLTTVRLTAGRTATSGHRRTGLTARLSRRTMKQDRAAARQFYASH